MSVIVRASPEALFVMHPWTPMACNVALRLPISLKKLAERAPRLRRQKIGTRTYDIYHILVDEKDGVTIGLAPGINERSE
jgi:hypothetical protein